MESSKRIKRMEIGDKVIVCNEMSQYAGKLGVITGIIYGGGVVVQVKFGRVPITWSKRFQARELAIVLKEV